MDRGKVVNIVFMSGVKVRPSLFSGPDCCIGASAMVRDTLTRFGIDSLLVPVKTTILNKPASELWLGNDRKLPEDEIESEEWTEAGAIIKEIGERKRGAGTDRSKWFGHLVCVVQDPCVLVDITLDQAHDEARGFNAAPAIFDCLPGFLTGTPMAYECHGQLVVYEARPDNKKYKSSSDFANAAHRKRAARACFDEAWPMVSRITNGQKKTGRNQ